MKRLIYSQYTDKINPDDFKSTQFQKYKNELEKKQKEYALSCNADYELFGADETNYDELQFQKILKLEELVNHYDEVLYLDFDVIPITKENFFEVFDLNKFSAYSFSRFPHDYPPNIITKNGIEIIQQQNFTKWVERDHFCDQSIYTKAAGANAMCKLSSGGYDPEYKLINTGVMGANKKVMDEIEFSDELPDMLDLLSDVKDIQVYHKNITNHFFKNNETFLTYLINSKQIEFNNIGKLWNNIVDDLFTDIPHDAKFIHHIDKLFEKTI